MKCDVSLYVMRSMLLPVTEWCAANLAQWTTLYDTTTNRWLVAFHLTGDATLASMSAMCVRCRVDVLVDGVHQ